MNHERSRRRIIRTRQFLNSSDMQRRKSNTAAIIKPNHNPVSLRAHSRAIRARNLVTMPTARDDRERLKRTRLEITTNISAAHNHPPANLESKDPHPGQANESRKAKFRFDSTVPQSLLPAVD